MRPFPLLVTAVSLLLAGSAIGCDESTDQEAAGKPVPSMGCLATPESGGEFGVGTWRRGLGVNDDWRALTLYVPTAYDGETPMPLVLELHDYGQDAAAMSAISGFRELGETEGFVTVALEGRGRSRSGESWDISPARRLDEGDALVTAIPEAAPTTQRWIFSDGGWDFDWAWPDGSMVESIIDFLGEELCLDLARVYATGLGNGGWATMTLACGMPQHFAAVAPVAGLVDFGDFSREHHDESCAERGRIPILAFHGTDDPHSLLEGGLGPLAHEQATNLGGTLAEHPVAAEPELQVPVPERAASIARDYGCSAESVSEELAPEVERLSYDCAGSTDVQLVLIEGAGHTWPGSAVTAADESRLGPTNMDIDATRMIWEFFSEHPKPA